MDPYSLAIRRPGAGARSQVSSAPGRSESLLLLLLSMAPSYLVP